MNAKTSPNRTGFTITECLVALTLMTVGIIAAAELAGGVATEKSRSQARFDALNTAENILESARATPWVKLNEEWAKSQNLPEHVLRNRPGRSLSVSIDAVPDRPILKKVTVAIRWDQRPGIAAAPVILAAYFAQSKQEEQP